MNITDLIIVISDFKAVYKQHEQNQDFTLKMTFDLINLNTCMFLGQCTNEFEKY